MSIIPESLGSARCPGLNLSQHIWYIPDGHTQTTCTICNECYSNENHHITDNMTRFNSISKANCDSYLYRNKVDNGIFNFSIWSSDKYKCFPGTGDGEVELPISGEFRLFINAYNLKEKQYYKFDILCNDDIIFSSPENMYYRTTYLSDAFYFLNKPISKGYLMNNLIFGVGDKMKININIFTLKKQDLFACHGFYGKVIIKDGVAYTSQNFKINHGYGLELSGIPLNTKLALFTTKPLTQILAFKCHNEYGLDKIENILVKQRLTALNISERKTNRHILALKEQLEKELEEYGKIKNEKDELDATY